MLDFMPQFFWIFLEPMRKDNYKQTKARYRTMMNQIFDENIYDIREQECSPIVLAKKKIILPEMDKKGITVVNNNSGFIITDSMGMVETLFAEQSMFTKTR